jgi:antitoxin CptB
MDEARLNRARFRAWRRGFREADLILGPFADSEIQTLNERDFVQFERLLDAPDHDVYAWILGVAKPPAEFDDALLANIARFAREAGHRAGAQA